MENGIKTPKPYCVVYPRGFLTMNQQTYTCSNCGETGHTFRQCVEPVSSYGVLVFRWVGQTPTWPLTAELCKDAKAQVVSSIQCVPEILMIQRKDSLGFMDIMRGKYKVNEPDYIKKQLRGMTLTERTKLLDGNFDDIWQSLWGSDMSSSYRYAYDRVTSKQKLTELRSGVTLPNGTTYTLADLLRQEPRYHETPEWGFPKGRRDPHESDIQCAFRELQEETAILPGELWKAVNVAPFIEQFYGSNDIHYRHTYYLAQYIGTRKISYDVLNSEMTREIGNLAWKTLDEALLLLRPENVEKRGILLQLATLLRNFLPVFKESVLTNSRRLSITENTTEEQERYVFSSRADISTKTNRTKRFFGTR